MQKKSLISIGIVGLVVLLGIFMVWRTQPPAGRPHYKLSQFTVTHSDGTVLPFTAELAITPAEQSYGLMFVRDLPNNQGMIFPYTPPREVAFWMKNTLIPLDMLFVGADGRVGGIVANARPQDLTPIDSQIQVSAVIEIAGGVAKKNHIEIGDKVSSPALTH